MKRRIDPQIKTRLEKIENDLATGALVVAGAP
jgi:hypothetical protein